VVLHHIDPIAGVRLKSLLRPRSFSLDFVDAWNAENRAPRLARSVARYTAGVVDKASTAPEPAGCPPKVMPSQPCEVPATFESGLAYEGRVGSRVPHSSPQEQHPTTLTPHDRIAAEEMKFPGPR